MGAPPKHNGRGFTLLEVVLAMAISIVVFALVARAIELYLVRFDESRCMVEANQLMRGVVDQIAADLRAVRLSSTAGSSGASSQEGEQGGNSGTENGVASSSENQGGSGGDGFGGGSLGSSSEAVIRGLFGDATRLRIDRAAPPALMRRFLGEESLLTMQPADLPQSVTYFYREGRQLSPTQFASLGVAPEQLGDCGGLCVWRSPTDAAVLVDDPLMAAEDSGAEQAELLAPEVLELTFGYFDGEELRETWDSAEQERLPAAVQVELKVLIERNEEPQRQARPLATGSNQVRPEDVLVQQVWLEVPVAAAGRIADGPKPRQTEDALQGSNRSSNQPQNQGGGGGNSSSRN